MRPVPVGWAVVAVGWAAAGPAQPPADPAWPAAVAGKPLGDWLRLTASPDPAVREQAARAVPRFGPAARKPAVGDLRKLCVDPDPGVRVAAFQAIAALGYEDKGDRKAVADAVALGLRQTVPGSFTRPYAIRTLAAFGPDAHAAIPAVDGCRTEKWWETRRAVAWALGRLGAAAYDDPPAQDAAGRPVPKRPPSDAAGRTLRWMLANDDAAAVRREAALALLALGPPYAATAADYQRAAAPALEAVTAQLKREKDRTVTAWLHVLRAMYDGSAFDDGLGKLIELAADADPAVRVQALSALALAGEKAAPAAGVVAECLNAPTADDRDVQAAAVNCLGAIGRPAAVALGRLEAFRDRTPDPALKELTIAAIAVIRGSGSAAPK